MNPGGLVPGEAGDLGPLASVRLPVSVELGSMRLTLRELLALQPGSVHTLDRRLDEPVTVLVNDRPVARGEIVAVDDRYGVRLTEILGAVA